MFENMFRFKFLIYLAVIMAFFYGGVNYVENTEIVELEKWRIPKIVEVQDSVALLLQALAALVIAVTIYFMGKFHDYFRSYVEKMGEFEESVIRFSHQTKPKSSDLLQISKKSKHFENKLEHQKSDSGIVIGITIGMLFYLAYLFYRLTNHDLDGAKENFSYVLSLSFAILIFFLHWYHLDYMISNRQRFFKELVLDLAKLRAFTSTK